MIMNTSQLLRAIRSDMLLVDFCLGVFPADKLPVVRRTPSCLIANTDPHTKAGTHWLLLIFPTPNTCEFFDSYGRHPPPAFARVLRTYDRVKCNRRQVQSAGTTVCGPHCLYVAYCRARGVPFASILDDLYTTDPVQNDRDVSAFVTDTFGQAAPLVSHALICEQVCRVMEKIYK
jgi:hypothetical protein